MAKIAKLKAPQEELERGIGASRTLNDEPPNPETYYSKEGARSSRRRAFFHALLAARQWRARARTTFLAIMNMYLCDETDVMPADSIADEMEGVKYERQSFATLKSATFDDKPFYDKLYDKALSIRILAYFGALLPGIGCYTCIAYTYIFQIERVHNFTTFSCPDVYIFFPPVSYSIGVWDPQKYFWLFVMFVHMPPRLFYPYFYKKMFNTIKHEVSEQRWFQGVLWWYMRTMYIEPLGLIAITVFDMEKVFMLHALSYTVWIVAFNFNMLFTVILQDASGARELTKLHNQTWLLKRFLLITGIALSVSTGISYGLYAFWCVGEAYVTFTSAEYILVGYNSLFHFLMLFEFSNVKVEMRYDLEMIGQEKSQKFKNVDITVYPEEKQQPAC
ncbi:hypothetical protein L596_002099 [Steinernema carpocapsae]|uniref:CWH43-like N-terminal domain-containing protein n=1 Tax=Steinernema carpocapsae TaxID=34508 RepID=A0A4U8UNK2_STECR|nr:hypothetical protein L596_002099 [Steinernema carpocapsae]